MSLKNYSGNIGIMGGFIAASSEPLIQAPDIVVDDDGTRLDEKLNNIEVGATTALVQQTAATGTNLNEYKIAGLYYFSGESEYFNLPTGVVNGWLEVFTRGNNYIKQIFHRHGSVTNDNCHQTFVRNYCASKNSSTGYAWSDWKCFATLEELETGKIVPKKATEAKGLTNKLCILVTCIRGTYKSGETHELNIHATIPVQAAPTNIVSWSAFKSFFIQNAELGTYYSASGNCATSVLTSIYHDGTDVYCTFVGTCLDIAIGGGKENTLNLSDSAVSISNISGASTFVIGIG